MNQSGYPHHDDSQDRGDRGHWYGPFVGYLPDTTLVSFGKPKAMWQPILATYEQRLSKAGSFRHVVLREKGDGADAVKAAATKSLAPYVDDAFIVVFDERGKSMSSIAFAHLLASVRPRRLTAVIGSSYGLAPDFMERADRLVGLGAMTLPHELARVTAIEQLYRAETILAGHPYHHA
jgi:23S rRNA (pseudouridine1915-N3)-methyltransferase